MFQIGPSVRVNTRFPSLSVAAEIGRPAISRSERRSFTKNPRPGTTLSTSRPLVDPGVTYAAGEALGSHRATSDVPNSVSGSSSTGKHGTLSRLIPTGKLAVNAM